MNAEIPSRLLKVRMRRECYCTIVVRRAVVVSRLLQQNSAGYKRSKEKKWGIFGVVTRSNDNFALFVKAL